MLRVSYEMLKTYKSCPRRYKFVYIDHLKDSYKQAKAEFTLGQHVHTTLKKLLAEVPREERTTDKAHQLLRQVWQTNRNGFASRDEEKQYGERGLAMLDIFLRSTLQPQALHLEQSIRFTLTNGIMLYGRVDRVDQDSSGAVHLIDYKTGKLSPTFVDRGQLAVYSVLVKKGLDLPIVSASYWYLEQNEFVSFYPKEHDFEVIIDDIIRTVERIQADHAFPPLPSNVCKWCEFIDICPASAEAIKIKEAQVVDFE